MTCGFMNSAGTDLDSLFYTNNGNAGAVGFQCSNGQDLGNRYTNANTLGYAVGYQNSAGTDLGNLRGNCPPASMSGQWCNWNAYSNKAFDFDSTYGEQTYRDYQWVTWGYINVGSVCSSSGTWQLAFAILCGNNGNYQPKHTWFKWQDNSTANMGMNGMSGTEVKLNANSESGWTWVYNGATGTNPSRNFAITMYHYDNNRSSKGRTLGLRVYQRFGNSAGWTGWWNKDFWFV